LQLGVDNPSDDKLTLLTQLYQRLVRLYELGKKSVVLIDEAQMLQNREIMEEFRGLLNLEMPERKLLSFVFFGLPELENNLMLDPPLAQRVAVRYRLEPLNQQSTEAYIKHRLRIAGSKKMFFLSKAVEGIHLYSRGIPRLINTICDNCLFETALLRRIAVDRSMVDMVAKNLGLDSSLENIEAFRARRNAGVLVPGEFSANRIQPSDSERSVTMREIDNFLDSYGKI
jgi:type II secretory pathway predicted ATPase ExeA